MLVLHVRPPLPNKAGKACMRETSGTQKLVPRLGTFSIGIPPFFSLLVCLCVYVCFSCSPPSAAATCLSPPSADDTHKVHDVHTYVGQLGFAQPPRPVDGLCRMTGTKSLPRASLDAVPGWRR